MVKILGLIVVIGAVAGVGWWYARYGGPQPTAPAEERFLSRNIDTGRGLLTLTYDRSRATLAGELSRPTPCVDYQVTVREGESLDRVEFIITDIRKGVVCIQVLGEPQRISATASAKIATTYVVQLEDNLVFQGRLD